MKIIILVAVLGLPARVFARAVSPSVGFYVSQFACRSATARLSHRSGLSPI